jgi:LPXTG-motif cell wall-anchored protein
MSDSKFMRLCKRAWLAPHDLVAKLQFVWRHGPVSRNNAERVDRICNPSKYRGKEGEIEEFARKSRLIGPAHHFSWILLAAGATLIVLAAAGQIPSFGGSRALWIVLLGITIMIGGLGLLLRRRSL